MTRKFWAEVVVAVAALYSGAAMAGYQLNFTRGATRLTDEVYDLRNVMMWIIAVIFCAVFAVMFYAVYQHRKSVGHKAAQFHENTAVELAWTVVPFFILVALAIPATRTLLTVHASSHPGIAVKVAGNQWKQGYDHLNVEGAGVRFVANLSTPHGKLFDTDLAAVIDHDLTHDNHAHCPTAESCVGSPLPTTMRSIFIVI